MIGNGREDAMRRGWLLTLLIASTASASAGGCATKCCAPVIELQDWHAAAGVAKYYHTTGTSLLVVRHDDFGSEPKLLWRLTLTSPERVALARALAGIPVDHLLPEYADPRVANGQTIRFELPRSDGVPRTIEVSNTDRAELRPLVDLINRLLPDEHAIIWPDARSAVIFPATRESEGGSSLFGDPE